MSISIQLVVEPTYLKNMLLKLDHETPGKGENKKKLKPPPSIYVHPRKLTWAPKMMGLGKPQP